MRTLLRWVLLVSLLAGASTYAHAQDADGKGGNSAGITRKQAEKAKAKKEKKNKKEVAKEEKRLNKQHLKNQDPAARKRMKANKRRADRGGQGPHRDSFFRRLFSR
jgi:uncharacterized protein HemX